MGLLSSRVNFEIRQILISNPEIRNRRLDCWPRQLCESNLRFQISGFEMQDSSDFEILHASQQ
jgi:hypothetical protein